ncbi:hypothetical protein LINPERPRIM_LOCUS10281 [Linum perenne]
MARLETTWFHHLCFTSLPHRRLVPPARDPSSPLSRLLRDPLWMELNNRGDQHRGTDGDTARLGRPTHQRKVRGRPLARGGTRQC